MLKLCLKLIIVISLLYLALLNVNKHDLFYIASQTDLYCVLGFFIMQLISQSISAARSKAYHRGYGINLSYHNAHLLYYIGSLFNIALPGGIAGDGYKAYYISKQFNCEKSRTFRIQLYERVNGFYALILLGFLIAPFSLLLTTDLLLYLNYLLLILVTPIYLLGVKYILKDHIKIAISAIPYSFLVQILQVISSTFLVFAFLQKPSIEIIMSFNTIFIAASIIAILPISIGGIGLREVVFVFMLKLINIDPAFGVVIGTTIFLSQLLFAIIGLSLYSLSHYNKIRNSSL